MEDFIAGLPKAELHCHIEGTLEPELLFALAARGGVRVPYPSVEALRAAYSFADLQGFLDLYYQGMAVLNSERDFYDLTRAYLARAQAENIRHVELFFDPQGHVPRGVAFAAVMEGITAALDEAAAEHDISSCLIMCFLRHLPERDAFTALEWAEPWRDRIAAVGLDSSERGHPPEQFRAVFAAARDAGYRCVAHAGEEGPADYVRGALDALEVARIDHGNAAADDPVLYARLKREQVPLTMCPLSNLRLGVVDDLADHPVGRMLADGLCVTVNSDDPAYFGGYLCDNYAAIAAALGLDRPALVQLARNSITASFAPATRQRALLAALDDYAGAVQ